MPVTIKAYIFLLVTTAGWAANAVIGKFAVGHIGPMTLTLGRWSVAILLLMPFALPQVRRDWPEIRRHWLLLLGFGVFGFTAFNALLYSAVGFTSAINCAIEQAGIPGLIFIGNYLLFRTKVSLAQIAGYTVTLSGVVLTASHGSLSALAALEFNVGDLLMLGACLVYAIYTVGLRWKPPVHWMSLMIATSFGGVAGALPLFFWEVSSGAFIVPDISGWMTMLFTGVVPSLISQILYVRGIEMIGPNRAGLFINTIPVFGTFLSVVFLGEAFQNYHFLALAMVLGGIAIAERGKA